MKSSLVLVASSLAVFWACGNQASQYGTEGLARQHMAATPTPTPLPSAKAIGGHFSVTIPRQGSVCYVYALIPQVGSGGTLYTLNADAIGGGTNNAPAPAVDMVLEPTGGNTYTNASNKVQIKLEAANLGADASSSAVKVVFLRYYGQTALATDTDAAAACGANATPPNTDDAGSTSYATSSDIGTSTDFGVSTDFGTSTGSDGDWGATSTIAATSTAWGSNVQILCNSNGTGCQPVDLNAP